MLPKAAELLESNSYSEAGSITAQVNLTIRIINVVLVEGQEYFSDSVYKAFRTFIPKVKHRCKFHWYINAQVQDKMANRPSLFIPPLYNTYLNKL